MKKPNLINLTLLNHLNKELNDQMLKINNTAANLYYTDYISELSKALGSVNAIALEITALGEDIVREIKDNSGYQPLQSQVFDTTDLKNKN